MNDLLQFLEKIIDKHRVRGHRLGTRLDLVVFPDCAVHLDGVVALSSFRLHVGKRLEV